MDWKKEQISAAELERRQKEYMNAAMSMVKRSHTVEVITAKPPEPEPHEPEPEEAAAAQESVPEKPGKADTPEKAEKSEEAEKPEEPADAAPETAEEKAPEIDEPVPDEEPQKDPGSGKDPNYGVYTAEELLSGEAEGAGLKKAAEILEEMTRSTEMMRKLANDDGDAGTTDFPDFSCDKGGKEGGDCFREEQEAPEECSTEKNGSDRQ